MNKPLCAKAVMKWAFAFLTQVSSKMRARLATLGLPASLSSRAVSRLSALQGEDQQGGERGESEERRCQGQQEHLTLHLCGLGSNYS